MRVDVGDASSGASGKWDGDEKVAEFRDGISDYGGKHTVCESGGGEVDGDGGAGMLGPGA